MLSKIQNELLFAGVIKKSNEKVRKDILEDNRKAAIFWATIQLIFWSFSLFMSRIDSEYIDCLPVYIIVLAICGIALFLALYTCPRDLHLVPAVATALKDKPTLLMLLPGVKPANLSAGISPRAK